MVVIQLVSISGSATKISLAQVLSVDTAEKSPETEWSLYHLQLHSSSIQRNEEPGCSKMRQSQTSIPFSLMLQRFFLSMSHYG